MQSFIDKWVTINNIKINQTKYPPIFYLNWSKNKCRPYKDKHAYFLKELPKHNFYRKVKWTEGYIYVVGNFPKDQSYNFKKTEITHEQLLKSHLQKCVRRQLCTKAISSTYSLMSLNFQSFIRRLPIIMIEDTILHESFSTLIWMMLAYPKWKPTIKQYEWLLGVIHFITSCHVYDKPELTNIPRNQELSYNNNYSKELYSLHIRRVFGGLEGDIEMINKYIKIWNNRFISGDIPKEYSQKIKIVDINSVEPLMKNDIEYSAVDFHCFRFILNWINTSYPEYDDVEIRRAIWYGSAGFNKRHEKNILNTCDKMYKDIWFKIKGEYYKVCKYIINKLN